MRKNQMTREQFEILCFEEMMEWAFENLDCVTDEDTLIQFAVEKIESDNLGLALHILNAVYNNPYNTELYRYDYYMGTLEKPTPITDKEDIEDLIDFVIR